MAKPNGPPGKTASSVPASGKGSRTTQPSSAGAVLPVDNPMDLWYLCQKAGFAEKFPLTDSAGRSLKQRQVSRWIRADCYFSFWRWPYWGEVGFDMTPAGGGPPRAIMSRTEPQRPTTMPLSRYELLRRHAALQAGVLSGILPWTEMGLSGPLVTTDYLENNLSPNELRGLYGKLVPVADSLLGWELDNYNRPKIPGLLRIPDVIRLRDFQILSGADRFAADNIAFLIEMKFEGDSLSEEQAQDYLKIVNHEQNKFRLLETKMCKVSRRKRRAWLEEARKSEPVFRTVESSVTAPERLEQLNDQAPQSANLIYGIEEEHRAVRRVLQPPPLDPNVPQMRQWDPKQDEAAEASRQRTRSKIELSVGGVLAGTATATVGTALVAGSALGDAAVLVSAGARTLIRFPAGRFVVTATAANAAIFEAAAQPPAQPPAGGIIPVTVPDNATTRLIEMENKLNQGSPVYVLYIEE